MKVAYIAGSYRANTIMGILDNIHIASKVALEYWKKGYAVICPHRNTALFDGECADVIWLQGDLELLRRSDVVVMLPFWTHSKGAIAEHAEATRHGKEIIYHEDH